MNKFIVLLFTFLALASWSWAKQVELSRAQKVAASFISGQSNLKSVSVDELIPVRIKIPGEERIIRMKSTPVDNNQLVYLFKKPDTGFVLVSGDDLAKPILGYSSTEKIDEDNLPVNMLKWLEDYKKQIRFIRNNDQLKSAKPSSEWQLLEDGLPLQHDATDDVSPLMTTTWNQAPFYNDLCPQEYWFSEKAVTGCVATAMAQVMKYHNWPKQGKGIHSYYHSNNTVTYGNLSANFGATTYDWANMPNALNASSSAKQVNAVATLMLHCGIGVNMNYSPETSGAWVTEAKSQEETCAELALKEFFGYDESSVKGVQREGLSTTQWINLIKSELDAKRPVLFAGLGDGGGHAFVADGYTSGNYFHMNWGWGGIADGYYTVDAFNPGDLGTGAGSGGYNSYQRVVIGIQPPAQAAEYDLRLYGEIMIPAVYQLNSFRVDFKLANYGNSNFNGQLGLALFDQYGDFVEFVDVFDGSLDAQKYSNAWFDSEGIAAYPGWYYWGIYYKPTDGNWMALADGDYENFIAAEVISPFADTDIKLYDSILTTPNPLVVGGEYRIDTKIANYANTDYSGQLGAGLFYHNGDLAQELEVITDAKLTAQNFYNVYFNEGTINVEPGSYLIGLVHFPDNSDEQVVIAPGDYINPVRVNVTIPPLGPDDFENNDLVDNAAQFGVSFEDDYDGLYTIGTNIHSETDEDYYMVDLPEGYNYTILARAHDSYSSELGDDYTCDVIWAHSKNGEWSELYDDEMDTPYRIYNGGKVYFGVIPYFEGQTGSYAFSVEILRDVYTGTDEQMVGDGIDVFPNPVSDRLTIKGLNIIDSYQLFNSSGKLIATNEVHEVNFSVPVTDHIPGLYFLKLFEGNRVLTKKILINE